MSYDPATRSHIAAVRAALTTIGKEFPKPVLVALAEHDKIKAAAREFPQVSQDQIEKAVAEAFLDDRDPTTDEDVRRLLTAQTLGGNLASGYGLNLENPAEGRVVAALTATADTIIATLTPACDEAGRNLTQASDLLGDQDDPAAIIRTGVAAAVEAWTQAQKARKLIAALDAGWSSLAALTQFASDGGYPVLRLADLDVDTLDKVSRTADAWAVVRAGGRIELADRTTMPQRHARIADGRQQRIQHQADEIQRVASRPFSLR